MGKYMNKWKVAGDVAVMKVPTQSSQCVRTRAKTLALQSHCKSSSSSSSSPVDANASSFSYLQLRSRRLPKVLVGGKKPRPSPPKSHRHCCNGSPTSTSRGMIANSRVREISSMKPGSVISEKGHFRGEIAKGSDEYVY